MKTSRGPEKPATSLTSRFASGNSSAISRYGRDYPADSDEGDCPGDPADQHPMGNRRAPLTSQAIAATTQAAASP